MVYQENVCLICFLRRKKFIKKKNRTQKHTECIKKTTYMYILQDKSNHNVKKL